MITQKGAIGQCQGFWSEMLDNSDDNLFELQLKEWMVD